MSRQKYIKPEMKSLEERKYNDEITAISMEFVEMVFKMMDSNRKKKTFWVSKTSEKIYKLLAQGRKQEREEYKKKFEEWLEAEDRHTYDRYLDHLEEVRLLTEDKE